MPENIKTNAQEKGEQATSPERLPQPVYYIESPNDDTVLVGVNVAIDYDVNKETGAARISWYDTTRERSMQAAKTEQDGDYFAFVRAEQEGGGTYYFAPMSLEIYNNEVKQRLADGADFINDDDMIQAFLSTTENE